MYMTLIILLEFGFILVFFRFEEDQLSSILFYVLFFSFLVYSCILLYNQ